jgi:hypothetical protein
MFNLIKKLLTMWHFESKISISFPSCVFLFNSITRIDHLATNSPTMLSNVSLGRINSFL